MCLAVVDVAAFVWWSSASEQNTWNFAKVNSKEAFVFTGLVAMKLHLDCSSMNITKLYYSTLDYQIKGGYGINILLLNGKNKRPKGAFKVKLIAILRCLFGSLE